MSLTHLPSQQQARQTTSEQSQSSCNKVLPRALRFEMVLAGSGWFWPGWTSLDFLICRSVNGGWAGWVIAIQILAEYKALPGSGGAPNYSCPPIFRQLLTPLNYNVLQLYHKALRVTLLQGLLAEHTSG